MLPESLVDDLHRHLVSDGVPEEAGRLRAVVTDLACRRAPLLGDDELAGLVDAVVARVVGLGPLDALLADPEVSEVMVNGPGPVWIERRGRVERTPVVLDLAMAELLVERVVLPLGLRADRTAPLVDARLPDGSRVNAVVRPLAVDGPYLTIRRFGARAVDLGDCCGTGVAELLTWAVGARCNVVVAGGTGAGKTTLLNALAAHIPATERLVTVEDAAELRLEHPHVVRLEARTANAEGVGEVGIRELVRNALRMRPDRIVVGEVRGGEALDLLQAMNTGHEGSLTTLHANGPDDALRRLETMVLLAGVGLPLDAVRDQLDASVDLVVQVARGADGSRRVVSVSEVGSGVPGGRTRLLADADRLLAAPTRPPRRPGSEGFE